MNNWIKQCYSRLLIDNHITENDPSFMTKFDPHIYVSNVKKAGVEAAMVYACCHNGNCYYPTRVGHMHKNLKGRDIFGETVTLLRKEGIVPIAYYTTIYHNHSAKTHPAWRVQDITGKQHQGRYWFSCPNNPDYRAFTLQQIAEVIAYDVDGIFVDMTFFPTVCFCPACRGRYLAETGKEIPTVINWRDPEWVQFQRFREQSITSFTQEITAKIKSIKDITVTHQNSLIITGWSTAQDNGVADSCDYTSGDFYGGKYQHILGAKVLSAASRNVPFEFMTSRCVNLNDHTSMKSEAELLCEASTTLANGGAYFFIDAINPDGTLENRVYDRLGSVSKKLQPFTKKVKELNPVLVADTALYYSMQSHIDEKYNGVDLNQVFGSRGSLDLTTTPTVEELMGTSAILARMHRPFRVIRNDAESFKDIKTLIVNNAIFMSKEEINHLRHFVRNGGTLVATGWSSFLLPDGTGNGDFSLADVFGVSYAGSNSRRFHYLTLPEVPHYVACYRSAPLVKPTTANIVARITDPMFDPDDPVCYASIHSNPPGRLSDFAGLTVNNFGKGKCIYLSSSVFSQQLDAQQTFANWLFSTYAPSSLIEATNAPASVEITILRSTSQNTYLVCFVNYQKELPNVPVVGLYVTIKLPGVDFLHSVTCVSDGSRLEYTNSNGSIHIEISHLDTIEMVEIK